MGKRSFFQDMGPIIKTKIVLCIICDNKCTPKIWRYILLKSFWVRFLSPRLLADDKFSKFVNTN